ncbi:MAG: chorismate synthase [Methanosarcinaceae archaeon]|nr:chorismate synthase [Methanosarcinaceae archaeon]
MSGNTFGKLFKVTTWGESHGKAVGVVIDGVFPGISIDEQFIQSFLDLRRPGTSKFVSERLEEDKVEILSGVFEGLTTGAPLSLIVYNKDFKKSEYEEFKNIPRPGHADFGYISKYGIFDFYGGGRSSGRETVARVCAGAVAQKILFEKFGISICCHIVQLGEIRAKYDINESAEILLKKRDDIFFCVDENAKLKMEIEILKIKNEGDSVGGIIAGKISNVKAGLGEPVFEKAESKIGSALFGIGGVKGVEFGAGFKSSDMKGSVFNDSIFIDETDKIYFKTNNSGGISGGITTGQDIDFKIAIRPTSSISKPRYSVDLKTRKPVTIESKGRHDPAFLIRVVPVAEAMASIAILDLIMENTVSVSRL